MNQTRALLLTDIVDSTELASRLGDDEAAALNAAHDRLARDLLRVWRGREIDKTDGMLMLFDTAADAAGYALAYHRALAGLSVPMKARAGLHVGAVVLRTNNAEDVARGAKPLEVHGIAKPTAARVMALALGGQTLLTAEARAGLAAPAFRVQTHGHWKLKGVPEPLELFELGAEGASFAPMPDTAKAYRVIREGDLWLPLRDIRHSLPAERDAFVGRNESLAELARHFEGGARLVSILGIGGTGKTRLATYFAWAQLGEYPGGVWFCDLSQARDVNGIVSAVALGLEVPLGKEDPVEQLAYAIAGRGSCLVILDNFEQVARHADETLGRWLDRAAHAKFMVTTREVLGLPGEETLALAPLPLVDAVDLFTKRALAAKYDFAPNEEDRAAIPQLVKLLDGLPLAVELAAARVRVMQPRMLLSRMDQRFKLLSVSGGRHDRQATLRTTFDWSWDLLSPAEKAALAQLSVFDGGFNIESAEAVLDLSGTDEVHWAVDILQSLIDKSFVRSVSAGRFDLLASVQDYAAEHLRTPDRYDGSGPEALASAQVRHLEYFASLTDREATANRCIELGNLESACRRACAGGKAGLAVRTLERAWEALELRGPFGVGVSLAERVRDMPDLAPGARARVERVLGAAQYAVGNSAEAKQHFEAALRTSDDTLKAKLYVDLAKIEASEGNFEASRAGFSRALTAARSVKGRLVECAALNGLGSACVDQGRFDEARTHYSHALLIAREVGDRHWEGGLLGNLGNVHAALGRFEDARADYEDGLRTAREIGDRRWEGNALSNLGLLSDEQGRPAEALPQFETALRIAREIGHRKLEGKVLCNLGLAHQSLEQTAQAQANFEAAVAVAQAVGDRQTQGQALGYLGLMLAKQGRFDAARDHLSNGADMLRAISSRFDLGLLLCARAEAEILGGNSGAALGALAESTAIATEIDAESTTESELALALRRVRQLVSRASPA
jgi:predicted ATPase/class 3 adenylate cyclase/Tfp pilus assembly protein PilF